MPNLPRRRHSKQRNTIVAGSNQALYNKPSWRRTSKSYRRDNPLCEVCSHVGTVRACTVTDHIISIQSGGQIWDTRNFMALCEEHHNRKRAYERSGWVIDGLDGVPVDRTQVMNKLIIKVVLLDGSTQGGV